MTATEDDIFEELILTDRNSGDNPHPYLLFHPDLGVITIANDYEPVNDELARDFHISAKDAIVLAGVLLDYALANLPE